MLDLEAVIAPSASFPLPSLTEISLFWFSLLCCTYFWLGSFSSSLPPSFHPSLSLFPSLFPLFLLSHIPPVYSMCMKARGGWGMSWYLIPYVIQFRQISFSFLNPESGWQPEKPRYSPSFSSPTHIQIPQHWGYELPQYHAHFFLCMWMLKIPLQDPMHAQQSVLSIKTSPQSLLYYLSI